MAERWWISTSDTSFDNTANWAEANGTGVGGFSVPTAGDNVHFNGSGTANCYFGSLTKFDDFIVSAEYPGVIYDSGYDVWIYGNLNQYKSSLQISSTSTWYQKADGTHYNGNTSSPIKHWVVESGVTYYGSTQYSHAKKISFREHSRLDDSAAALRFVITYPTEHQSLEIHPTARVDSMRYYVNTVDIEQSGWSSDVNMDYFFVGYGGSTGAELIMQGDINVNNYVWVHAANGAKTEAQARVLNMNGYNLNCGSLDLGTNTPSYDGYAGKIKFGSGTHTIGDFVFDWQNTYCYVDWGTATVNLTGQANMRGLKHSHGSGTLNLVGTGGQTIVGSGYIAAHINIDKPSNRASIGEPGVHFNSMDVIRGDFDFNNYYVRASGDFRVLESGRLWGASVPSQADAVFYCRGNVELYGSEDNPMIVKDLTIGFDSPSTGVTRYAYVNNSSYSGDSYMDATHPTNLGYEGAVSGWQFCDLYYPIETPAGRIMVNRTYTGV